MMSKKDYVRAAELVRTHYAAAKMEVPKKILKKNETDMTETAAVVQEAFVSFFRGDNPRFDADRFREACKL